MTLIGVAFYNMSTDEELPRGASRAPEPDPVPTPLPEPYRLEPAPSPTPEDPRTLFVRAKVASREKRWVDAASLLQRARVLAPQDKEIEAALSQAQKALADQELLRRSAEALREEREWRTRLQGLRVSLKKAEDAADLVNGRTYARQILEIVPNDLPARAYQERDLVETRARADQLVLDLDEQGIRQLWEAYSQAWPGDLRASAELARSIRRVERGRSILAKRAQSPHTP